MRQLLVTLAPVAEPHSESWRTYSLVLASITSPRLPVAGASLRVARQHQCNVHGRQVTPVRGAGLIVGPSGVQMSRLISVMSLWLLCRTSLRVEVISFELFI